jgi:hypothetical protein
MTITTRARVAFLVAVATLLIAGFAGGPQLASAGTEGEGGGSEPAVHDGVAAACAAPEPGLESDGECNDTIGTAPSGLGSCGEQVIGTGPDASVASTPPCAGDDSGGALVPGGGALPVEPRPGMADVHPLGFDRAVVSDDGTSVTIYFWSGVEPCYVLDHVDVSYGRDAITVTLFEGHDPSAGDVACIEIAQLKTTVVQLDQSVGDRAIVDGAR